MVQCLVFGALEVVRQTPGIGGRVVYPTRSFTASTTMTTTTTTICVAQVKSENLGDFNHPDSRRPRLESEQQARCAIETAQDKPIDFNPYSTLPVQSGKRCQLSGAHLYSRVYLRFMSCALVHASHFSPVGHAFVLLQASRRCSCTLIPAGLTILPFSSFYDDLSLSLVPVKEQAFALALYLCVSAILGWETAILLRCCVQCPDAV
jgi:hypothetical protein